MGNKRHTTGVNDQHVGLQNRRSGCKSLVVCQADVAQLAEHLASNQKVTSSTLVIRSILNCRKTEEGIDSMKKLVIHPKDDTTVFLTKAYERLDDVTLVQGNVTKNQIRDMISSHDQTIMLGHGTAAGLLSVGQFPGAPGHIIDHSFASQLAAKNDSVFIWCNADQYVNRYRLSGFSTGMFISEVSEAYLMGLGSTTQREVDESNGLFVETIGAVADRGPRLMHAAARHRYGQLANRNRVAKYNHERLYLSGGGLSI